jgi:hypothetical protein
LSSSRGEVADRIRAVELKVQQVLDTANTEVHPYIHIYIGIYVYIHIYEIYV